MDQKLDLSDFDYDLPRDLIAQRPIIPRGSSRLLVVHRDSGELEDRRFSDLEEYLRTGDVLVLNDTQVMPARLLGRKPTGGKVELLLIGPYEDKDEKVWEVLCRPQIKEGQEILFNAGRFQARAVGKNRQGFSLIRFELPNVRQWIEQHGGVPLPPYIQREPDEQDRLDYQTVFARIPGAVAAPTAALHFTERILEGIKLKGVGVVTLTLHVGPGTFLPVRDIGRHAMHPERFVLEEEAAQKIQETKDRGRKVWAAGTTTVRVLETCVQNGRLIPGKGETNLFIKPPFDFEIVGGLLTNFHLPRTSLLMLVGALMGIDLLHRSYRHAVNERYRFYSYGDAMLIL